MDIMTDKELLLRYRNFLVQFARHYVIMMELAKAIREDSKKETHGGKISGMLCQSNTIRKRAFLLKSILMEDGASLRHYFGTLNLYEIAKREIILSK